MCLLIALYPSTTICEQPSNLMSERCQALTKSKSQCCLPPCKKDNLDHHYCFKPPTPTTTKAVKLVKKHKDNEKPKNINRIHTIQ
jgi:hypothetical protein